jgi:YVTN family beta-propeller protein
MNKLAMYCAVCLLVGCLLAMGEAAEDKPGAYLGPETIVAHKDGTTLFVAERDANQVAVVQVPAGKVLHRIALPAEPTSMVLSADGKTLYVTAAAPKSTVCAIDTASAKISFTLPAGHTATGVAVSPDGKRLYVCNRFNNDVWVFDLAEKKETARVPVVREPVGAVITPDGKTLFVINHLPIDPSNSYDVAAVISVLDTESLKLSNIRLPNGSTGLRGVCITPDGKHVLATHLLARYQLPTTQLERGWMNTNALSIIDAANKKLINTILLDNVDLGAANPWGLHTADGQTLVVAHAGTREISVIDLPGVLKKLEAIQSGGVKEVQPGIIYSGSFTALDVPNDLAFLVDLRRRIKLPGHGPRGVAVVGQTAYVTQYFSDSLAAVDLSPSVSPARAVQEIALGPKPQLTVQRRGELLFNDATICFQQWQSCASCHPDARVDGLNWDLLNDGMGNPKNNRSMLLAHQTPPAMTEAVRGGAEEAVRSGITHILFAVRPEEEAVAMDEYLKSLKPVPSPYLVDGKLSPAAERGRKLFFDPKVGCAKCHPEPLYTDMKMYDVGSRGELDRRDDFDTPTLIESWRTAPYMHDGRYSTMKEVFTKGKHGLNGVKLTPEQIDDLVEFVLSL